MAARRCSIDAINFPTDWNFKKCPVCDEETDYVSNIEQDDDWADRVATLQEHLAKAADQPEEILEVDARVHLCGEHLCVNSDDVYHSGGKRKDWPLEPLTLIKIGQQTFEILAFQREPKRRYIVRVFATTLSDEDLRRLACPE